jgi:ribonuclease P protein component
VRVAPRAESDSLFNSFAMGRRDDRLRDPEAFRAALMSRPIARSGPFSVYRTVSSSGFQLGFVIPKKLVKTAVQRNQIKRWARDLFRAFETSDTKSESWVLRVSQPLPKKDWLAQGKAKSKQDVCQVMETALEK